MEDRLKATMSQVLNLPVEEIGDGTSTSTVKNWDSLAQMNLILALEEEFDVEFAVRDIQSLTSYESLSSALGKMA